MHPHGGIDAGKPLGQGQHGGHVIEVEAGHDQPHHAGFGRPRDDRLNVVVERLEV
jgi:hypothetical protein